MSKAFTREDDAGDTPLPTPVSLLPPGMRNYLTSEGRDRLQQELNRLREDRPVLVEGSLRDPELRPELAQLDQRVQILERSLASAEVIEPGSPDEVRFGSRVTVHDASGVEATYRIVGVDEADFSRGDISWRSPLATALLGARPDQIVRFRAPSGMMELAVVKIA